MRYSGRPSGALEAGLVGVVFLACIWPLFEGRAFLYGDLGNWHLPVRVFYAKALAAGDSPLWLPDLFSGFYLHGEGQAGMFHPLHWVLYRFLPLSVAFALECTLAYPFAFLGTLLFLRRLRLPRVAAVVGAAALSLSTYLLVRYTHLNAVAVIAHLPWILWLLAVASPLASPLASDGKAPRVRELSLLSLIGIAMLTASQVLLGYPVALVYTVTFAGFYAVYLCVDSHSLWPLGILVVATALGCLVGAVQLLPTFEHYELSQRVGASATELSAQSLHPWNLLQLLSPYLFERRVYQLGIANPIEQTLYLGATAPVALLWLGLRWKHIRDHRRLLVWLGLGCLVALVLATGRYTGVHHIFSSLPVLGSLRAPARFTIFLHLGYALALAIAFADLLRVARSQDEEGRRAARWLWTLPAASVLLAVWMLVPTLLPTLLPTSLAHDTQIADRGWVLLGPGLFAVAAGLWVAAVYGRRGAIALLVLFIAADPAAYASSLWWSVPPVEPARFAAAIPRVPAPAPAPEPDLGGGRVAVGWSDLIRINPSGDVIFFASPRYLLGGASLVAGYAALVPAKRLPEYSPENLDLANTRYLLDKGKYVPREPPLPRFRLVSRAIVPRDLLAEIKSVDLRVSALLDEPVKLEPGAPGSVSVLSDRPGNIRLRVRAPTRQLLLVSESHHPGWQVQIDSAPGRVLRANGDYIGIVVPAGEHEVHLNFRPDSFRLGRNLSFAGLALLVVLGGVALTSRSNRRSGREPQGASQPRAPRAAHR